MKSRTARAGLAAATVATLLAGVAVAGAEEDPASAATITSVQSLSSGLRVTGSAALAALAPVTVAEDAAGDSPLPGTDIVGGEITALGGGVTRFSMLIDNMGPGGASLPGVIHHSWDLSVVNGEKVTDVTLKGINRGAVLASAEGGSLDQASFAVQTCSADASTGQNTCTSTYVTGAFTDAGVDIDVPNTLIGLQSGSLVLPGENAMYTNIGFSDALWFSGPNGTESVTHADYVAPVGEVKLGVAPAGTPVEDVVLDSSAVVKGTAWTTTLAKPEPGDYVVVAQACHAGVCGDKVSKAATVR